MCYNCIIKRKEREYTMKTFKEWYKDVSGKDFDEKVIHNGNWFLERGLPLVVSCTCCNSTFVLPSAYIDEEDYIYCPSCAGVE